MLDDDDQSSGAAPTASPFVRAVTTTLAALLTLGALAWALDIQRKVFGLLLYDQQIVSWLLGIGFALVYLHVPAGGGQRTKVPWYDWVAAVAGLAVGIYIGVRYDYLYRSMAYLPTDGIIIACILSVLTLEGLRRVAGNVLLIILLCFIAYCMFGHYIPGDLQGREVDYRDLVLYIAFDVNGLIGPILSIALTIVISFLLFGAILFRSGGSAFFTDISMALMGRYRGGSAKIAVTASALFGSISGSALANVVSTGVVTIPLMKKAGYKPQQAGAIEAVASTGGQLMPPIMGAAAFLMSEFIQVPYSTIVAAAVIPSLLFYLSLFLQADLEAAKNKILPVERSMIPSLREVMKSGWHFPIPFAVLIGALFWWNKPAELAAIYGSAALIVFGMVFGYRGKRMTLHTLGTAITSTGFMVISIAMIAAAGGIIVATLGVSGLGFALTLFLVSLGGGNIVGLLVVAAFISILLGMGMPTVAVYVLLATLVAPSLVEVGISPLGAHMFVMYFGMLSMITPPVAIAGYGAATIAKAEPIRTCLEAIRFGWPSYIVPFLFVFSPGLLMVGAPLTVVWITLTAIIGVWVATIAVVGYFVRPLGVPMRIVLFLAGVATLLPSTLFAGAEWTDVVGLLVSAALLGWEWTQGRTRKVPMPATAPIEGPSAAE